MSYQGENYRKVITAFENGQVPIEHYDGKHGLYSVSAVVTKYRGHNIDITDNSLVQEIWDHCYELSIKPLLVGSLDGIICVNWFCKKWAQFTSRDAYMSFMLQFVAFINSVEEVQLVFDDDNFNQEAHPINQGELVMINPHFDESNYSREWDLVLDESDKNSSTWRLII